MEEKLAVMNRLVLLMIMIQRSWFVEHVLMSPGLRYELSSYLEATIILVAGAILNCHLPFTTYCNHFV